MVLFKKKKSLDKISLGELHLIKAEIETIRDQYVATRKDMDFNIQKILERIQIEDDTDFLAEKIGHLLDMKNVAVTELNICEKKLLAVDRLIRAKEQSQILSNTHSDILNVLDIDEFKEEEETQKFNRELQEMRIDRILKSETDLDCSEIKMILDSVRNGESIDVAQSELESLSIKRRL